MKKFKISHVFIYLLLILLTLICVVPFYIMVINATHSTIVYRTECCTRKVSAGQPAEYAFHGKYAAGLFKQRDRIIFIDLFVNLFWCDDGIRPV